MSQIDDATCRAEFEAWAVDKLLDVTTRDDCPARYQYDETQFAWMAYRYALGLAAGGAQPDRNSHEYYEHHAAPAPSASPGPEVAQDQLAATPLPKGEQRAFVEGAGGSAATPSEVAAAIEWLLHAEIFGTLPDIVRDIRLVCAAASRAPGPDDTKDAVRWRKFRDDFDHTDALHMLANGTDFYNETLDLAIARDAAEAAPGADHV